MKFLAKVRKREGRSYELAMKIMLNESDAKRFTLVHGTIVSQLLEPPLCFDHAWIELDDGRIFDPVANCYERADKWHANTIAKHRYTHLEVRRMVAATGNVGPWTDAERQAASVRPSGPL